MPYIGRTLGQGTRSRFLYTATAGQTTFSGSDSQSNTLAYADNNGLDCFQNGVLLKGGGADYTATTGTSVVLTTGASVSDVIEILVYDVFAIADHVKKSGDVMTGALTNIDVNGTELILDADGDTSITADTDDQIDFKTGGSDRVTINSSGNVGIGETDISGFGGTYKGLDVAYKGSGLAGRTDNPTLDVRSNIFYDGSNYKYGEGSTTAGQLSVGGAQLIFSNAPSGTAGATATLTERMRIDTSGNLLVGQTSQNTNVTGFSARQNSLNHFCRDTSATDSGVLLLNKKTGDGDILVIQKDGSTVGKIGSRGGEFIAIGSGDTNLEFNFGSNQVNPSSGTGNRDNAIDLGASVARFDDIFATNGTIQTSDQNEKQDIASATAKELNVAKKLSSLFKTFRWKDKVTEKGDKARTHTGIVAQEVQSAFEAEGLDASKYGLFISDTWTNEDGKEQTRLGVRYPELFSFIFSSIEARLTALESK